MEKTSLTDFVGTASGNEQSGGDDASGEAVQPPRPTSVWATGGGCDRCGEPVDRRWPAGDALVCVNCVDW